MTKYIDKPLSLVERKKQQWAKEREELAALNRRWDSVEGHNSVDRPLGRSRYDSKNSMVGNNEFSRKDLTGNYQKSSLPPLYKNQYISNDKYDQEKDLGGETSGYGSDNPNHTPEYQKTQWNQSGYESSSSFRDDRPKWGDKGVGIGKFWQSKQEAMEKVTTYEPPNWVKRGLQDGEIVVTNTSPAESPEQIYEQQERPCTGSSSSQNRTTYIRGQNIPLDSVELAERERRRQIALAHQQAIRQQLEEREKLRREERERRINEEREEELRIEREQEIERQRKDREQKLLQEKIERERKRKEALQEAIEVAEKESKLEKIKLKMLKQTSNNIFNMTENIIEKDKVTNASDDIKLCNNNNNSDINDNELDDNRFKCIQQSTTSSPFNKNDNLNYEINNNLEINGRTLYTPRDITSNKPKTPIDSINNNKIINNNKSITPVPSSRGESVFILPNSIEGFQSLQYALIMPSLGIPTPSTIPIAIPITMAHTEIGSSTSRTENRILTPTQYRYRNKRLCDSSTQTDYLDINRLETSESREKYLREKMTNLELAYENRSRKERRSRNEDRRSESMEERPKWGANRPPTRYLKQSEKDPLYQRRKLRQKIRDTKMFDDKNSSDESQIATTPRSYRKKSYIEKRHSRSLWQKGDQIFARNNVRMYQTEIVPLESDKDHIYYKKIDHECCCQCRCERHKYSSDNVKVDILKIEHNSPRESYKAEMIQSSDRLPDCNSNESNCDILDKLSSLRNGLLLKQEQWENSPRTPLLSSLNRH